MRVLLIGYNSGVINALNDSPDDHDVWVLEEPGLWEIKSTMGTAPECFRGVILGEYQQVESYRDLIPALPDVDAVAPGLEYAVPAAADIADRLGKRSAGLGAAQILRDKLKLREATSRAGMAAPEFAEVTCAADVADFLRGGDAVLKPAGRQASLGVQLLSSGDDVEAAWAATTGAVETALCVAQRDMSWRYLIERRLVGQEYSTEALIEEGAIRFLNVTRQGNHLGASPVETEHSLPHDLHDPRWQDAVAKLVRAVEFGTGILHAEWIDTIDGLVLVECAGRPPGDRLVDLIDRAWGFSLAESWLLLLAGLSRDLPSVPVRGAAIKFLVAPPGELVEVSGIDDARSAPGVWHAEITAVPGSDIGPLRSSWDRAGSVATTGDDAAHAERLAHEGASRVRFVVQESA